MRHRNVTFPRRRDIFHLATTILKSLTPFRQGRLTLRLAQETARQDWPLLNSDLVADIVT